MCYNSLILNAAGKTSPSVTYRHTHTDRETHTHTQALTHTRRDTLLGWARKIYAHFVSISNTHVTCKLSIERGRVRQRQGRGGSGRGSKDQDTRISHGTGCAAVYREWDSGRERGATLRLKTEETISLQMIIADRRQMQTKGTTTTARAATKKCCSCDCDTPTRSCFALWLAFRFADTDTNVS